MAQVNVPASDGSPLDSPTKDDLCKIIVDAVHLHYTSPTDALPVYFKPTHIGDICKTKTTPNKSTNFYFPITVAPHSDDDHMANADDFFDSITRFQLQRMHHFGPGQLPVTA
jgi:hypothetical protein